MFQEAAPEGAFFISREREWPSAASLRGSRMRKDSGPSRIGTTLPAVVVGNIPGGMEPWPPARERQSMRKLRRSSWRGKSGNRSKAIGLFSLLTRQDSQKPAKNPSSICSSISGSQDSLPSRTPSKKSGMGNGLPPQNDSRDPSGTSRLREGPEESCKNLIPDGLLHREGCWGKRGNCSWCDEEVRIRCGREKG